MLHETSTDVIVKGKIIICPECIATPDTLVRIAVSYSCLLTFRCGNDDGMLSMLKAFLNCILGNYHNMGMPKIVQIGAPKTTTKRLLAALSILGKRQEGMSPASAIK